MALPPPLEMSEQDFLHLSQLVYARCGIRIEPELKYVMEKRLRRRLEALGLPDFRAYRRFLTENAGREDELEAAIEALATHETYFFREPMQLQAFSRELLPALRRANQASRKLRIWSAGCSTGEEPYTVSILVQESGLFEGWDLQIFGSDLSKRVLEQARQGEYGPSSLRAAPKQDIAKHFERVGARVRVKDAVRSLVTFGQVNLLEPDAAALLPQMDVILCRNVLIYFDLESKLRALSTLYDKLKPGGYLLLGHSETLIHVTGDFELVHLRSDMVYRRPGGD